MDRTFSGLLKDRPPFTFQGTIIGVKRIQDTAWVVRSDNQNHTTADTTIRIKVTGTVQSIAEPRPRCTATVPTTPTTIRAVLAAIAAPELHNVYPFKDIGGRHLTYLMPVRPTRPVQMLILVLGLFCHNNYCKLKYLWCFRLEEEYTTTNYLPRRLNQYDYEYNTKLNTQESNFERPNTLETVGTTTRWHWAKYSHGSQI